MQRRVFIAKFVLSCTGASGDDVLKSRDDPSDCNGMLSLKGKRCGSSLNLGS